MAKDKSFYKKIVLRNLYKIDFLFGDGNKTAMAISYRDLILRSSFFGFYKGSLKNLFKNKKQAKMQ
ncbi:hypothetical protein BWD14_16405 [Leptospira santarosai]|uniref:Uncharacterized protein n=1 Tax=Leptospira santarosai TaxID=28183 RepID=A0AB73LLB5_9LEPT|nr:hypothetical protein BV917_10935 [Leptospira santarosai serovar Guaricura]ONF91589.1 hypothetical protein BWD14_16405 [Leptospira santarosai]